jgi:taurine transport system substrate-binding protein
VQQSGEIEKATGYKINWRMFGGGGDVIRAMASGDVAIGEAGSAPIATAISQGLDVELFWILEDIAAAEALVARNGSNINPCRPGGRRSAAVSTTRFHLLYAMELGTQARRRASLNSDHPKSRPHEVAATWSTFIWDRCSPP